jgi:hypothetical protein
MVPFDYFEVRLEVDPCYPSVEPRVTETAGRLPHLSDRHINADGRCCLVVWEQWLVQAEDTSFAGFLAGPLRQFFLSQSLFEKTGEWRFGERAHGTAGILEAYAEVLGVKQKQHALISRLELLSKPWPKGHWPCPCGSGRIIRKCHQEELWSLHQRVPPAIAKRMLRKLGESIDADAKLAEVLTQLDKLKKRRVETVIGAMLPSRFGRG